MATSVTLTNNASRQVREERSARGWTQQELAERCREVGLEWDRTIVAKFEKGHRVSLSVEELSKLALALSVPPLALLVPLLHGEPVSLAPGVDAQPNDARRWFEGVGALPQAVWPQDPASSRRWKNSADLLRSYREYDAALGEVRHALGVFLRSGGGSVRSRSQLVASAQAYVDIWRMMVVDGLVPPVPEDALLAEIEAVGVSLPHRPGAEAAEEG